MLYIYAELLYHHFLIFSKTKTRLKFDNSGQTLVEFILLLSVLMLTSMIFLSTVNTGTSTLWEAIANILVEDPKQKLKLR